MATCDKHCQTFFNSECQNSDDYAQVMYDETVNVVNAREIDSPTSEEDKEEVVIPSMSKFNPPVRHTARHDFDSDSDTDSEPDKFLDNGSVEEQFENTSQPSDRSLEMVKPAAKATNSRSRPAVSRRNDSSHSAGCSRVVPLAPGQDLMVISREIEENSQISKESEIDTDSVELEQPDRVDPVITSGRKRGVVIPAEGAYDPKQFQDLKVPSDMENIFQYIMKYTPQKIDIDLKLQPFVPEYMPAVGDIDAFIKVTTPACNVRTAPLPDHVLEHIDNLGLTVLDEPAAEQSDSALLHLQLRAISKTSSAKSTVLTKKIDNPEKNFKAIERWIKDVSELHLSKPAPTVAYTNKMPDIDTLMEEWPEPMEETLNDVGFPPSNLDCSLSQYVDLVCGTFDIPVGGGKLNDRIQALHLLFSLYSAVKNSQLYAERQKENDNTT